MGIHQFRLSGGGGYGGSTYLFIKKDTPIKIFDSGNNVGTTVYLVPLL